MIIDEAFSKELESYFGTQREVNPYVYKNTGLIIDFINAKTLAAKIDLWDEIHQWVSKEHDAYFKRPGDENLTTVPRVVLHIEIIENCPLIREKYQLVLGQMVSAMNAVNAFGEAGVPSHRGFLSELSVRFAQIFLPLPRDDHDFAKFLRRQYRDATHITFFHSLSPEIFLRMQDCILPSNKKEFLKPLLNGFADGFRILAAKIHLHGLGEGIRSKLTTASVSESAFHSIVLTSDRLMSAFQKGEDLTPVIAPWKKDAQGCRAELNIVHRKMEERGGISIDLVFSMDLMEECLSRMDLMVSIIEKPYGVEQTQLIQSLMEKLVLGVQEDRSIRSLIRRNTHLLYRKIIERSGQLGEHYIALNKHQYWHIWVAAAGGGLLTVFTAAVKLRLYGWGLAPFMEGLAAGLNYSISFVILHICGFVLATKQPAMTAATLAKSMNNQNRHRVIREIIDIAPTVAYTQVAAAAGNVLIVAIGAYCFSFLWLMLAGTPFLSHDYAEHTYATLSPLDSGTVFYAALTGVILWLASLIGGWFDNWSTYHRIPQGISDHRSGNLLGTEKLKKISGYYERNNAALATNISLGMMLGMTHSLGLFFGIPLDVRHVTLSTGTLALAAASLEKAWFMDGWFIKALSGIAVMFVLNLGVSFFLSLFTAARAFRWPFKDSVSLTRKLFWRFIKAPWDFIFPPLDYWRKDKPENKNPDSLVPDSK